MNQVVPCGHCLACRINRRRLWTHRLLLEAAASSDSSFLTLTYADEHLPMTKNGQSPTLSPMHLQRWLKRFRRRVAPLKLRFYAVGEYGEDNGRPHYHLAMFGWPVCRRGQTRWSRAGKCCEACDPIRETWGMGSIMSLELNSYTAQYIVGYVIKKMTAADDNRLQPGQFPEFARMSNRPGIGAALMDDLASKVMQYELVDVDVPGALDHGRRRLPLGRYLKRRLRVRVGLEANAPAVATVGAREELQAMRKLAWDSARPLSEVIKEVYQPKTDQVERRYRFHKHRGKL